MNALYKPLFGNRSISVATRAITNERNATTATTFCHDVFFVSLISDLMSYCNEKKKNFNLFHKRAKFKYKIKVYFDTLNKVHVSCHKTELIYLYLNMKVSNKKKQISGDKRKERRTFGYAKGATAINYL